MYTALDIDAQQPDPQVLQTAAEWVRRGGVVALPTETVYGLAVDARQAAAVEKVFALKGRPETKPLPVLVSGVLEAEQYALEPPPLFYRLAEQFWPGPLTMIVPDAGNLAPAVSAGTASIAVRHSPLPLLRQLLTLVGGPLTATSANRSGLSPCGSVSEILRQWEGGFHLPLLILDGGATRQLQPSTIVDLTRTPAQVVRWGVLAPDQLSPYLP